MPTTTAGAAAVLDYVAEHARRGEGFGAHYVIDDNPRSGWEAEHGVTFEVALHKNLAKALGG
jgi:hypothetical protein